MSDNPLFLCGLPAGKVRAMGYDFHLRFVPENELPLLLEIGRASKLFMENIPPGNLREYTLSYDFHITPPSGKLLLVNHKITALRLTRENQVWLSLCSVSVSSRTRPGNLEMTRKGQKEWWKYDLENRQWYENEAIVLKDDEKNILVMSMQGYTMQEISERLYKSLDSIKAYKRRMFKKMEVDNITEAIFFAVNNNLL